MVHLWNLSDEFQKVRSYKTEDRVYSARFSPDERFIATGGQSSPILIWETNTGLEHMRFGDLFTTTPSLTFHPTRPLLITSRAIDGPEEAVQLRNLDTKEVNMELRGHENFVAFLDLSPDSKTLATASVDTTLKLWDLESGQAFMTLEGHKASAASVAFSSDGRYLISGSEDETVRLWDARSGEELAILSEHSDTVIQVAFGLDGLFASSSYDGTVRLWRLGNLR